MTTQIQSGDLLFNRGPERAIAGQQKMNARIAPNNLLRNAYKKGMIFLLDKPADMANHEMATRNPQLRSDGSSGNRRPEWLEIDAIWQHSPLIMRPRRAEKR